MKTLKDRLFSKVLIPEDKNECWIWNGARDQHGYGQIYDGKKRRATHVSWEFHNGIKFPEGMHACHTCDNPRCVNPLHIWPGTRSENMQDSVKKGRFYKPTNPIIAQINRNKTHCKMGHELTGDNVYIIKTGGRDCKECRRERDRKYRAKKAIVNRVMKGE